jgi:hypothetical protein
MEKPVTVGTCRFLTREVTNKSERKWDLRVYAPVVPAHASKKRGESPLRSPPPAEQPVDHRERPSNNLRRDGSPIFFRLKKREDLM